MNFTPFNATIFRNGGAGFYSVAESIGNIYQIRVFNKYKRATTIRIRLGKGTPVGYELSVTEQTFVIPPLSEISRT